MLMSRSIDTRYRHRNTMRNDPNKRWRTGKLRGDLRFMLRKPDPPEVSATPEPSPKQSRDVPKSILWFKHPRRVVTA